MIKTALARRDCGKKGFDGKGGWADLVQAQQEGKTRLPEDFSGQFG
jgi:hypothetical protein